MVRNEINTVEFWDSQWRNHHNYYRESKERDVVYGEIFKRTTPGKFLDIGGGLSRLAHLAKDLKYDPFVIDLSPQAVEMLIVDKISAQVVNLLDLNTTWIGFNFEFVTATEILEHLTEPERVIDYAGMHADKLFVSVPTPQAPPCPDHLRTYTEISLEQFLKKYYNSVEVVRLNRDYLFAEASGWH